MHSVYSNVIFLTNWIVNSRYIICKGKRPDSLPVLEYMRDINQDLCKLLVSTSADDVNELVPFDMIEDDRQFYQYIRDSNEM